MRVIVCGGRDHKNLVQIGQRLAKLPDGTQLVHGACRTGVDSFVDWFAVPPKFPKPERHPALWRKYGTPTAAHKRNQEMADAGADLCIAFPTAKSTGTWDMIRRAENAGIPVEIHDELKRSEP